jgi:hypothetical protein
VEVETELKPGLEDSEVPFSLEDLMAEGYTASQCLDFVDAYYSRGILPHGRQVSPDSSIEKSIHSKYPQYAVHEYVDVKRRDPWLWNLVGNGEAYSSIYGPDGELTRAGCGWLYKDEGLGCLNVDAHKDHMAIVKLIVNSCMRPQCPVCYEKWAAREAYRIDERFRRVPKLSGERRGLAESRTPWGVPIHVVISVPEFEAPLMDLVELTAKGGKFVKVNGFTKLKRKMAKIAKRVGFKGGCAIFHPFANEEVNEDENITVKVDPASGEFDYKALKAYFAKQNKNVKLWYIRPHFHLIGYGWIEGTAEEYDRSGWVVKNLGVRDSVMCTALYQLSHAGYREGQHTVSWLGFMSNRLFKDCDPYPPDGFRVPVCFECGAELVHVKWTGPGVSPLDYVTEEGSYYVDPGGWVEIPLAEYRGRIVRPLEGERVR